MTDATKRCYRCREHLPIARFSLCRRNPDGLQSACKRCRAEQRRALASAVETPPAEMACGECAETKPFEAFTRSRSARYGRMRICKPCMANRTAAYRAKNPELARDSNRRGNAKYRATNRDAIRQRGRAYRAANLFTHHQRGWVNRTRRFGGVVVEFTETQFRGRISMFDGCWMCGGDATEIDHVKPLAKGGAHMLCNIRPVCRPCNCSKRDRWPLHQWTPTAIANAIDGVVPAIVH